MRLYSPLLVLLLTAQFTLAQQHGRLPDGTAFRIDSEGNQLIDQLAEYELQVEELKRRVVFLEDELAESKSQSKPLKENTLVQSRPLVQNSPQEASFVKVPESSECNEALQRITAQHQEEQIKLSKKIEELSITSTKAEKELAAARHQLAQLSLGAEPKARLQTSMLDDGSDGVVRLSTRNLTSRISALGKQVQLRDKLYAAQKNTTVKLSPTKLISASGVSYEQLKEASKTITSERDSKAVAATIEQLELIVSNDISALRRLQ